MTFILEKWMDKVLRVMGFILYIPLELVCWIPLNVLGYALPFRHREWMDWKLPLLATWQMMDEVDSRKVDHYYHSNYVALFLIRLLALVILVTAGAIFTACFPLVFFTRWTVLNLKESKR